MKLQREDIHPLQDTCPYFLKGNRDQREHFTEVPRRFCTREPYSRKAVSPGGCHRTPRLVCYPSS